MKKYSLPKIKKHKLSLLNEGTGSSNPKEYCNCDDCVTLKKRRDSIFNKPKHKILRYFNNNF